MFNEDEDWNDEQDAQTLSGPVPSSTQRASSSTCIKAKVVGKRSLLRTLQTLGPVPDWKDDSHQQDSDSETEVAPSPTKKKKKRRKRRKQAETTGEQQENGDVDQTVQEEKPVAKKRKKDNRFGSKNVKPTAVGDTKDKEPSKSEKEDVTKANGVKLTRQQWKNKMKNKKKCKNKYRQNKEEEIKTAESSETHKPKEEAMTEACSNNNKETAKRKEKERKPQKRQKTEDDTGTSCVTETQPLREEKQNEKNKTKSGKVQKDVTEASADGSIQKAEEPHPDITDDQQQPPMKRLKPQLTKIEMLKRERLQKKLQSQTPALPESPAQTEKEPAAPEEEVKQDRSSALRSRMEQRLESARFRFINELLYSSTSGEAKRMFKQDPEAFGIYHRGYTAQVQRWPANPVDQIISYIQKKLPSLVVADFGCGDCKIARSVKNKVHSFDLAAAGELVTVCDMANVPLRDGSVDIAVFCLSLMGTNLGDFLAEANRVLKMGGVLKIAEVASRFENVRSFITALANLGFKMVSKDTENTHFYSFELVKTGNAPENIKKFGLELKPCLYKKR